MLFLKRGKQKKTDDHALGGGLEHLSNAYVPETLSQRKLGCGIEFQFFLNFFILEMNASPSLEKESTIDL